jgi:SAM-dependent methyltransferase
VKCGDREFEQPPYEVRECATCGLLYKSNTASPAELDEYYATVDFRKWEIPGHFPTERAALSILRILPKESRFLDFGCSSGRLLAPLVGDYDCCGFEIRAEAAAMAEAKGLHMLAPGFLTRDQVQRFNAVVMVDVFEHLSSPTDLLRKLYPLLKAGGLLLIVTGNGDSAACRLDPAQFWYFRNVEHLCMLTRRNAAYLARELGARFEHWQEVSHYDAPLLKRLKQGAQRFSYWQFRHRTFLSKTVLPLIPRFNRARHWPMAPAYEVSRDHVLLGLRKP